MSASDSNPSTSGAAGVALRDWFAGQAMVGANQVGVFSYVESASDTGLSTDDVKKTNVVADRFSYHTTLTAEVKEAKPEAPNELNFTATTR